MESALSLVRGRRPGPADNAHAVELEELLQRRQVLALFHHAQEHAAAAGEEGRGKVLVGGRGQVVQGWAGLQAACSPSTATHDAWARQPAHPAGQSSHRSCALKASMLELAAGCAKSGPAGDTNLGQA